VATSTTGTGLIQALGIGSGLDIQSLVTRLVAAERAPVQARITRQASDVATRVSALGALKGALSAFQGALEPLKSLDDFDVRSAVAGDTNVFGASATGSAAPGAYGIEVQQLAQPEQLISTAFSGGGASVVGSGVLTLQLGSSPSFAVTLDSTHKTLADVRDAINGAAGNNGINATLVYGVNGAQLVLTSRATGAGNTLTVSASGGDGGLARLGYAPGATGNYTEQQAAQDAILLVSGVEHHSASNVVSGAIDGVTLTLKAANKGSSASLTVANDTATVTANIRKFVGAYNAMQSQFARLGSYDAASKSAGPMLGDWLLTDVSSAMVRGATDRVAGVSAGYGALAALGITTDSDGQLQIDDAKLSAALQSSPAAVATLFGGRGGVARRLDERLTSLLASNGAIEARDSNLSSAQKAIDTETTRLDDQMAVVQQRYLAQFTALDSLMSQLQATSNYLTQQLANAASIGNGSSTRSG
jgi:flagellar hook-associated protein 2